MRQGRSKLALNSCFPFLLISTCKYQLAGAHPRKMLSCFKTEACVRADNEYSFAFQVHMGYRGSCVELITYEPEGRFLCHDFNSKEKGLLEVWGTEGRFDGTKVQR